MSITLVYGMPGYGKTLWLHDYLKASENAEQRFFVVDHADEWGKDAAHWRGKPPRELFEYDGEELPEDFPDKGVFVFRDVEALDVAQRVLDVGNATFVDDEIDFCGGRQGWEDSPLRVIAHKGRHAKNRHGEPTQVNILGACRRPQSLHTDLTSLPFQVCVFRVQGSRTLERLKADSMIEDGDWETITNLPKFKFRHWPSGNYYDVQSIGENKDEDPSPDSHQK